MSSLTREPQTISIKTEVFEGPLDLLIELVEKRKLLINDISLAAVTDEYMQRVSLMQEKSLPNTAQFVQLAATLLLIKSKSLLPALELTEEEEGSIEELQDRLKLYQIYRDAGAVLAKQFGGARLYEPEFTPTRQPVFTPDKYCNKEELRATVDRVLKELPKPQLKPRVQLRKTISLEEMIERVRERVAKQMKTSFFELRRGAVEHKDVVVSFLAILELVKQGEVLVRQTIIFADIEVEKTKADTPSYY